MPTMHLIDLAAILPAGSLSVTAALLSGVATAVGGIAVSVATVFLRRNRIEARESTISLEEAMRRLEMAQERVAKEQTSNINVNVERLAEDLQVTSRGDVIFGKNSAQESERLIREVSHSINTPLAQIELSMTRLAETAPKTGLSPGLIDSIAKAEQSVQICRAVLAAYRELTSIALVAPQWDIGDLRKSTEAATDVLLSQTGRSSDGVGFEIRLPKSVTGYSNYLLLSLLLPLLQNAVEAASSYTPIRCRLEFAERLYRVHVSNIGRKPPDLDKLRIAGYTSKGQGHEGLGLSSVRTLLARQAHLGSNLEFSWINETRTFVATISLPLLGGVGND